MNNVANFRDLGGLTSILKGCLVLYIAIATISIWSGWLEIGLLQRVADGENVPQTEAVANDSRQAIIGGLYAITFLVTGITFLRWTYLSNRNARLLGASDMDFTPAWAVGWYFVPIANLWKPYQALKETFKASHPDFAEDWKQAAHPEILPVWWTLWILASFVGQAVFRTTFRAETLEELITSSSITLVSDVLDIPLGIVVVLLVSKLQTWQSEKHRRIATTEYSS